MSKKKEQSDDLDLSKFYVVSQQDLYISDFDSRDEWVLDVGGGGEGIIGMLKGRNVIAIDSLKQELIETNNESLKIVMDAKKLLFLDSTFSYVTAFFTFMYIPIDDFDTIFSELWRVMKPGGKFLVWEPIFAIPQQELSKRRAVIFLKIHFPDGKINETGYGGILRNQNLDSIVKPAQKIGFKVLDKKINDYYFFIKFQKPPLNIS